MNYQIGFVVTAILLVAFVIFYIFQRKAYDKILFDYKPLKLKYDTLKGDFDKLKAQSNVDIDFKSDVKPAKGKKTKKKVPAVSVDELNEKIRLLKDDNAKLKEKNYNLSRDNEKLRSSEKERSAGDESGQRELIALRDEKSTLASKLDAAEEKIRALENQLGEAKIEKTDEASPDDAEKLRVLEAEKAALSASLKTVRDELGALKRDFKSEVDAAKKAAKEDADGGGREIKKELAVAQKLVSQSKLRADNNHKIYLITRSQLLLVEQKLMQLDPSYRPLASLPVKNNAIDEYVKKFITSEARENKASIDVVQKNGVIRDLEGRIQKLEVELAAEKASAGIDGQADKILSNALADFESTFNLNDKSLGNFMNSLAVLDAEKNKKKNGSLDNSSGIGGLDLSKIDDDWDAL